MSRNTYAENIAELTKNTEEIISIVEGLNESMTGNDAEVVVNENITLPSYANIVKRVDRAEKTIASFTQGSGIVETNDNTFRKVRVTTVSRPPKDVDFTSTASDASTFSINANWFFESFQYPRCSVKINLSDNVDDDSDRAYVDRIIISTKQTTDKSEETVLELCRKNITAASSYASVIDFLNTYAIEYKEDKDEVKFPLTYEKYSGKFNITSISNLRNADDDVETWYYLDGVNYDIIDENDDVVDGGHLLTVGDYLRYENSLYKIVEINQVEKRVRLDFAVGYETLSVNTVMELYNTPFSEKIINVGISLDEYDAVFVKGVNENYNLLSRNWSNPICFYTNELVFEDDETVDFETYYTENVSDFGREMISKGKENRKYSYFGSIPNAPVINKDNLKVVQINTQLDATLDSDNYKKLAQETASLKTQIEATRTSIANNKDLMMNTHSGKDRYNLMSTIKSSTDYLNTLTSQFSSHVSEMSSLLNAAGVISYTPKYHVRGFFMIPENVSDEKIIGFELMYRYIHTDDTGAKLDSFNCDISGNENATESVVFSDWNLETSKLLINKYNEDTKKYEWISDTAGEATDIQINQIDIPIRSGEKVEIKARSISEVGYPYNPLKSEWSNLVRIEFPSNLSSNDYVTNNINDVKSDTISVTLESTLSAAGLYSHISDTNSRYRHNASNIEYYDTSSNVDGGYVYSKQLDAKIRELEERISKLEN